MKIVQTVLLVLILASLSACNSATATPTQAPSGYPGPGAQPTAPAVLQNPEVLYPDLTDGSEVSWSQAAGMILNGEVAKVTQSQDLKVTLSLKDGRTLLTTEAQIDQVLRVVEMCGDKCKGIETATE